MTNYFSALAKRHSDATALLARVSNAVEREIRDPNENGTFVRIGAYSKKSDAELCGSITGVPLTSDEIRVVRECCQEIQLRMLSGLYSVSTAGRQAQGRDGAGIFTSLTESELQAVCHTDSGVMFASFDDVTVVLLPLITRTTRIDPILDSILYIHDQTSRLTRWLVDMSMVEVLPVALLGTLVGDRRMLQQRGGDLHFCWVRETSLSPGMMKRFVQVCQLAHRGNHYFSEPWTAD